MEKTFCEMLRERLQAMREAANLQELVVYGGVPKEAMTLIKEHGHVGEENYEQWCHSEGTCAHNSHDPGEHSLTVYIPASWLAEARTASAIEWDLRDEETPLAVVPTIPPTLLVSVQETHWARWTRLVSLRPEAQALLGEL